MKQEVVTLVLGEAPLALGGEVFRPQSVKSAPAYSESHLPRQLIIGREQVQVAGHATTIDFKAYSPDVLLLQNRIEVDNIFSKDIFALEEAIFAQMYQMLRQRGGSAEFSEQYTIFVVSGYEQPADTLAKENAAVIASLLKSERLELDQREINYTLASQIKYARNDLAIIDWDGAFLFDPEGDVDEDLEILTLANLQLLRHRVLDRQLDERLERMGGMLAARTNGRVIFKSKEMARDLAEIIKVRMASISDLQRIEREIKLIGDWYSARFYELAAGKFKLEDWRRSIRGKLESLEDIYSFVVENFTVSTKHRAEWIQIIAFFILQIGWFLLIILEFIFYTRH